MPAPNQMTAALNPEVLEALATLSRHNVKIKIEDQLPAGYYRCSECGGLFSNTHFCVGKSRPGSITTVYGYSDQAIHTSADQG